MLIRIRSRDGLERITVQGPHATISHLKTLIQSNLNVPIPNQTLSTHQNLLLAKTPTELSTFSDMSDPHTTISSLGISHGSLIYLAYDGFRTVAGPSFHPAGFEGRKMTMDDLISRQVRISSQDSPHCEIASLDRDAANAFQHYVNESLAFAVKRGGFMYGTVSPEGRVGVQFIYEPPQMGGEEHLALLRDPEEENMVDAIALGLGMQRVGFIFSQTISQDKKDYTMSNVEILQAAELHSESGLREWVTTVVKLEVDKDGIADVHFEAFQMSDMCVKLFKEGWFETELGKGDEPKLSKMKKDVVVGGRDTRQLDNDFFLVVVKIGDHQGPLLSSFPIENRTPPVTTRALKPYLERSKNTSFVRKISDFHLLLLLARFLDVTADVPAIAECVQKELQIPEGYQLLIESIATTS